MTTNICTEEARRNNVNNKHICFKPVENRYWEIVQYFASWNFIAYTLYVPVLCTYVTQKYLYILYLPFDGVYLRMELQNIAFFFTEFYKPKLKCFLSILYIWPNTDNRIIVVCCRYADDSFTSAFVSTVGIDFKVKGNQHSRKFILSEKFKIFITII